MLDLTPILKRLSGISPWPWSAPSAFVFDAKGHAIGSAIPDPYLGCSGKNNAAFFGNAPQDIGDLLEEVRELREKVGELKGELSDLAVALEEEVYRR